MAGRHTQVPVLWVALHVAPCTPVGRSPYLPEGNASRYRSAPVRRIPLPEAPSQDPCLTAALLVCTWPCCRRSKEGRVQVIC